MAVYTGDNALLGKVIAAAVVPTETESLGALKKRIRLGCALRLAPFKVPSKVVLASESLYSARL